MAKRADSDEHYVLDLCDEVIGSSASRQHRFEWLRGDFSEKLQAQSYLPVDGYWHELALVVEYAERQHDERVAIFDKPDVMTVSGVHRGLQRRIYDQRRVELIPQNGLELIVIPASSFALKAGKIQRRPEVDRSVVLGLLAARRSRPRVAPSTGGLATPADIALELGISAKTVRQHLRDRFGLLDAQHETHWQLNDAEVAELRAHFGNRR